MTTHLICWMIMGLVTALLASRVEPDWTVIDGWGRYNAWATILQFIVVFCYVVTFIVAWPIWMIGYIVKKIVS